MSWGCNAGRTRSTTLAAEEDAAAAGTLMDNTTLVKLLMGEGMDDEDDDPMPTAAKPMAAVWPDEKHTKVRYLPLKTRILWSPTQRT
jgi:hypothetical protein